MVCDNHFCIYQQEGECLLEEIQLDCTGVCTNSIYHTLNEDYLQQEKVKLLQKYQQNDKM